MKKILFALAISMAVLVACDEPLDVECDIIEGAVINAVGNPLNGLWEYYSDENEPLACYDFTTPNSVCEVYYDVANEGYATQVMNKIEAGTKYYSEVFNFPFFKTFMVQGNPNVGAFLYDECLGLFYFVEGDKLTLWAWDSYALTADECKKIIAEHYGDKDFWKAADEASWKETFVRVPRMTALDLTHNRIAGWCPNYYDRYWGSWDSVPFRSGGRSVGVYDGDFYFYFYSQYSRVVMNFYLSEELWGKDIKIPDPDWSKKYGDARLSIRLEERGFSDDDEGTKLIWEATNESTSGDLKAIGGSLGLNFTYDVETRACKLSMGEDDNYSGAISIDATLEAWH